MNLSVILEQLSPFAFPQWHRGQLLALSGLDASSSTDYDGGLVLRTTADPAGLEIVRPARGLVTFAEAPTQPVIVSSDFFAFRSALGWTIGCLLDAHHLLIAGAAAASAMDGAVRAIARGDRCLVGTAEAFDVARIDADLDAVVAARSRWILGQSILGRSPGEIRPLIFKALSVMKGQVCSPEGAIGHRWTTPDRWPHKDMWLWDSVFHAIGWRHVDPVLAREMIDAVFDGQRADGFIPHQLSPTRGPSTITQPPLLAYGVRLVNDVAPDRDWIRLTYPKLCAYVAWDLANRDEDGDGLLEWLIEGDPISRSGESGMDNSPRFDFHYPARLAVTDFNAYLAVECETLAGFADMLGRAQDAASWRQKHAMLCRLINEYLWSETHGFYCDYDSGSGTRSPILSSAGFLPLICGAATPDRAAALARHLRDPDLFATAFPVPSIARRDHDHYSKDMWRGPTWVNINWLIARGLERYASQGDEFLELAQALDAATIAEVERSCRAHGTFFEYFDDRGAVEPPLLLRKGICDPSNPFRQVIHDYGWTTTLYLDLVWRHVIS
jgi:putative isomerase